MGHQEDSAKAPYMPDFADKCPRCDAKNIGRCRCMVGDHFCQVCGYHWRIGKLYWLPDDQQPGPTTVEQAETQPDKRYLEAVSPAPADKPGTMEDFYIAFRSGVLPGTAICLKVSIGREMIDAADKDRKFNIALCDHPLYLELVEYVRTNPPKGYRYKT